MKQDRIEIIDALRGFSLAGIVLVHMIENYIGAPSPPEAMAATNQGILDGIIQGFTGLFIQGKFFALFSFLFGLSFFIQMDSAYQKGEAFGKRFLWRLLLLLGVGYVHHLFYRGDILTIYGLLGILLIPFYKMNKKWVLAISIVLFLGIGRYVIFAFFGEQSIFSGIKMDGSSPEIVNYFDALKNGTMKEVFLSNATEGHLMKLDFQFGVFGRGYLTFGFFLLGLLIGKINFFQNYMTYKKELRKGLIWSIVLFLVSGGIMAGLFIIASDSGTTPISFDNWLTIVAMTAYDLSNTFMTFILIFAFILIFMKVKGERFLLKFAPYGRMALTNYIMQSIIGTFILYGWGMGYIGELRNIYTFGIGILLIIVQMLISKWWLHKFRYGPLEWLWRSLTFFKSFPFKKQQNAINKG